MDNITGYQWGSEFLYCGVYIFPNNLDKDEIHLPPNTTLKVPPESDQEIFWNGDDWEIKPKVLNGD